MVDDGRIALTPAVELSYLTKLEQRDLLETMDSEDCTPSLSQAIQMKRLSQSGELDIDRIFDILREPKANQIDKISFRTTISESIFLRATVLHGSKSTSSNCWKPTTVSASGHRKDKAWENIDLNEVSADEKGTAGYDVRLVADAFG